MTFEEVINYRRSIRYYKDLPIDPEKVKYDEQGVWGERIRIPFNEVYKQI